MTERPSDFAVIDHMPTMPVPQKVGISIGNLILMEDYRKAYLEGVRQQNIRSQTTKDKVSTLPLNAYIEPPPEPRNIDFVTMFGMDIDPERAPTIKPAKDSVFALDVNRVGLLLEDFTTAETRLTLSI